MSGAETNSPTPAAPSASAEPGSQPLSHDILYAGFLKNSSRHQPPGRTVFHLHPDPRTRIMDPKIDYFGRSALATVTWVSNAGGTRQIGRSSRFTDP